jgi:hypothetical protein
MSKSQNKNVSFSKILTKIMCESFSEVIIIKNQNKD